MTSVVKWPTIRLGDIAEFRNGVNYNKSSFGVGIKVIGVSDFQNYTKPKYEELEQINPKGIVTERNILHDEDIVFVRSNGNRELIGRSLFVEKPPEEVTHSAFTIRLRFSTSNVIPRFYAYCFRSQAVRQKLTAYGGGTNISNLNQEILSALEVPYPPLSIQHKIASILSAYDDLIENNTRRIKILEEIVQTIYNEWFAKFRFPGHENVKMVESELGMVPEGWDIKPVGELLDYHIGGGWGKESPIDKHSLPAYVIRGTDIPGARYVSIDALPFRFHTESNLFSRKLKDGDIVFEVSGGSKGQPVGRTLLIKQQMIDTLNEDVICASFCKLLRPKIEVISPEYFYLHLITIYSNGIINKYQVQSTGITNFNFAYFLDAEKLPIPPKDIIDKFTENIRPIYDLIQTFGLKNQNLRHTRELLIPKLISGEIDVSELDIDVGGITA